MDNQTDCEVIVWSQQAFSIIQPIFYISIIAIFTHLFFWIQFLLYPSVRQRSMQWLYAYLITDLLLLVRFFLSYIYRYSSLCIPHHPRIVICYCEAIFDNYLNLLQSYILLALNICRYLQIVRNHNVYSLNRRLILSAHLFIYVLPLLGHVTLIQRGWSHLQNPPGDACDLLPTSLLIRLVFLLFSYFIPVLLTLTFLLRSLNYIRNTDGIQSREIVDARLRHHRQLVIQSCVFYSLWLILWSPHLLVFPFYYKSSRVGIVAQIMNYMSIAVDPVVIAALDVRFLNAWKSSGDHVDRQVRRKRSVNIPIIVLSSPTESSKHTPEDNFDSK
ncbi:unnamed protein product [Adineta ricciae]|uniref:G-protein coupled receptors family 1 profile domain-containing protein n=1 Tax=Adineta ricciae TaxID=249248 RepID=A0A814MFE0_ADIRI|nr:unnamed protein product [Adineta ricciae]CAF1318525.1 unnamed protein product [Adineta ricciae]